MSFCKRFAGLPTSTSLVGPDQRQAPQVVVDGATQGIGSCRLLSVSTFRSWSFHPGEPRDRYPKAEPLRAAKLDLLREPSTAMPRYWAGFILIGDANQSVPIQPRRQWVEKNRWILAGCLMLSVIALLAPVAYKKQEGKVYGIGVRRLNFALRTSLFSLPLLQ